ncbi:MAG: OB-fold domain-containing protein, partial [Pseudomonadota bacterium]
ERDNRTAQSVAYRKSRDVMGFVGGRCKACGCVQFPKSIICVNPNCRAENSQEPYRFADMSARIKSFTEDWQAHTPDPPLRYGNVEFEEGGNVFMEFADCETADLAVGAPMRMAFRVKDYDEKRGFRRYFWKAVPGDK